MHFLKYLTFLLLSTSVFAKNVTVGSFSNERSKPMLIAIQDNTWSFVNNISGVPASQHPLYALAVDCKDNDCVTVGGGIGSDSTLPYILQSHDNGLTWRFPDAKGCRPADLNLRWTLFLVRMIYVSPQDLIMSMRLAIIRFF